jgi:hypothetical protein
MLKRLLLLTISAAASLALAVPALGLIGPEGVPLSVPPGLACNQASDFSALYKLTRRSREPTDLEQVIALSREQGFTIRSEAVRALKNLPDPATAREGADAGKARRVLLAYRDSPPAPSPGSAVRGGRGLQSTTRVAVSDHASLGCPVGAPAHVWWDSGFGAVSEVWRWATIGGQVGSTAGTGPSCWETTCRWYAYINGVRNRYYRSVDVYNRWYAFIRSAGCYY